MRLSVLHFQFKIIYQQGCGQQQRWANLSEIHSAPAMPALVRTLRSSEMKFGVYVCLSVCLLVCLSDFALIGCWAGGHIITCKDYHQKYVI